MVNLYNICWYVLAQTQVAAPSQAVGEAANKVADAAGGAAAPPKQGFFESMGIMFPILIGAMLLYFLMMTRPKPNNDANASELLANLKTNDRVVAAGGILGTVVNHRSDAEYVTLGSTIAATRGCKFLRNRLFACSQMRNQAKIDWLVSGRFDSPRDNLS